jgi:hypothetical protein
VPSSYVQLDDITTAASEPSAPSPRSRLGASTQSQVGGWVGGAIVQVAANNIHGALHDLNPVQYISAVYVAYPVLYRSVLSCRRCCCPVRSTWWQRTWAMGLKHTWVV